MAEQLKHFFGERVVRGIAADLRRAHARLDEAAFVRECLAGLGDLELTARGRHVAEVMGRHLPPRFPDAARVLVASLGPELVSSETFGMEPFRYLPHVVYVASRGLDDFEAAMAAQLELTKRFTAEFSIRAFLTRYPAATLERLRVWARDPNVHVRRLVSEGTRPRLPWAPRLRAFQEDPEPVIALLEMLRDDPERYVQRSVANNLNDISKDHPARAAALCAAWLADPTPGRRWIAGHALRSLVKQGHPAALATLGFAARPKVAVAGARITPAKVDIGDAVRFAFTLASRAKQTQRLVVDFAVHFVKANGATRPKVFKLRALDLAAGADVECAGSVSLAAMTTRKHYPGVHRIDALINGVAYPLGEFTVRP